MKIIHTYTDHTRICDDGSCGRIIRGKLRCDVADCIDIKRYIPQQWDGYKRVNVEYGFKGNVLRYIIEDHEIFKVP